MPIRCPTCSRVNPENAAYCYYDGRGLIRGAMDGPLSLGARPFPMPFSFSEGLGCENYNQLVLACDQRWNEARGFLSNGIWKSFFAAIGRADLADLAMRAGKDADPDMGLCRLLEGLPADAEAMRPPKLALPAATEDLGALEPGKDYKVQVVIANQGMLLLRGSATTECDWFVFGDRQGNTATKLFQTRDSYSLPVQVLGSKLHAGKKPLEGQIIIDTNGGREILTIRATVPIRPFPKGEGGKSVLAGAMSPRDIALKAKAHPQEAAVLFEQGVVKAWYESNGWTYPIRGTQARGKSAVQQFFEALGLTKPPQLQIDTEQVICQGPIGKRLVKRVTVHTAETKFVHAEAHSNQDWITIQPAIPQGNRVTIPLSIDVPPRLGETLIASVTLLGNGQQKFVVPVQLTVTDAPAAPEPKPAPVAPFLKWGLVGGAALLLFVIVLVVVKTRRHYEPEPITQETAVVSNQTGPPIEQLKREAADNMPIFNLLESKEDGERQHGYEQLAEKLGELSRRAKTRKPLGEFVTDRCIHEKDELTIRPLLRGLAHRLPEEDKPFPEVYKGEEAELVSFWLKVACDVIVHQDTSPDRIGGLVEVLGDVCGSSLNPRLARNELKDQVAKAFAEQCYHNLLPLADKSIDQALTLRGELLKKFAPRLVPAFRDQVDVKLLVRGLDKGNELWPKLEPIYQTCLEDPELNVRLPLIDLYDKANAELAPKMEGLLAGKWKIAGNTKKQQIEKVEILREIIRGEARAAKIDPKDRIKGLQKLLLQSPLAVAKAKGAPRSDPLLDTVRLARASTMAAILFNKDAERDRFDQQIGQVLSSEQDKTAEAKKPPPKPKQAKKDTELPDVDSGNYVDREFALTDNDFPDARRKTFNKELKVFLRAGEKYVLEMQSDDFKPYLRLETLAKVKLGEHKYNKNNITFYPQTDGDYTLVASSVDQQGQGKFKIRISRPKPERSTPQGILPPPLLPRYRLGFPRYIPPQYLLPPNPPPQQPAPRKTKPRKTKQDTKNDEPEPPLLDRSDVADLRNQNSEIRKAAFARLTSRLPDELPYPEAQKLAPYLLPTEWEPSDAELEFLTSQLATLARYPYLLQALADEVANEGKKFNPVRVAPTVGGLLEQKNVSFNPDEDWRSACRTLLLRRALELHRARERSAAAGSDPDLAAAFLHDLYKEQARAFGLDDQDFPEQAPVALVLEALIKHAASKDKAYAEPIARRLKAARFAAENDLELTVLFQRIWIEVLIHVLQEQKPAAKSKLTAVFQNLDKKDREAGNLLDQLRLGEENILQIWAYAHDLKLR